MNEKSPTVSVGSDPLLAESCARKFHEAYERLAPSYGYETRKESAVPWEQVPERNRKLMTAVCAEVARDTLRMNWLEEQNGRLQFEAEDEASLPYAIVYLPTLENGESTWREAARGDDFREAIDAAMLSSANIQVSRRPGDGLMQQNQPLEKP